MRRATRGRGERQRRDGGGVGRLRGLLRPGEERRQAREDQLVTVDQSPCRCAGKAVVDLLYCVKPPEAYEDLSDGQDQCSGWLGLPARPRAERSYAWEAFCRSGQSISPPNDGKAAGLCSDHLPSFNQRKSLRRGLRCSSPTVFEYSSASSVGSSPRLGTGMVDARRGVRREEAVSKRFASCALDSQETALTDLLASSWDVVPRSLKCFDAHVQFSTRLCKEHRRRSRQRSAQEPTRCAPGFAAGQPGEFSSRRRPLDAGQGAHHRVSISSGNARCYGMQRDRQLS